jgi:tRNA(Ile)-lysidine synthase
VRHEPAVLRTRAAVRSLLRDVPPGSTVVAAVSGGADSLALAAALAHVATKLRLTAGAVIVDHGLQPGSAEQAERAAEQCRALGLAPVTVRTVAVGRGGGPEAAARAARYAALDATAIDVGADVVLLGHTLDDQAETVLLGLARGSGARSLSGMAAVSGRYRRPFLGVRRTETRAACRALDLEAWHDPHNADPAYARVRVRREVLPALEQALGPAIVESLARSAELLRDDADALDEWADKAVADGLVVSALAALPKAVRTRVLRRAAIAAGAPAGALTARHVAEMDRLVRDWHGQGPVSLPGGLVAERSYDRLLLR